MSRLDWIVLVVTLGSIVAYGVWKGRAQKTLEDYIHAGRSLRWPTIALSIMATQASAITFLSTPGQAYADGMRFIQFYLGLPVAMVILAAFVVPHYHSLRVHTAYEFLETRFGPGTRTLTASLFLLQRGLSTGITLYAPSLILAVILGWNIHLTNAVIGVLVVIYTTTGGTRAVSRTHVHQLMIALGGMAVALVVAVRSLPAGVTFLDAARVAGRMGRLNAIDFTWDLKTPYNFWSGLIGGALVALSYFGTDQSQVQRYLTGESVAQSRLGLLVNGFLKVPMQFFILFAGAMVFVFYQFVAPPLSFNPSLRQKVASSSYAEEYSKVEQQHAGDVRAKQEAVTTLVTAMHADDRTGVANATTAVRAAQAADAKTRAAAAALVAKADPSAETSDTNYVFLTFVLHYLPSGLVGLVLAAILCAAMSATASGLNSLASTTVIDIYRRFISPDATDLHCVRASRVMTLFWGAFAIGFAEFVGRMGSLIEAVNKLGSLFYGTILAIFLLAFFTKEIGGTATFIGALLGEAAVAWCAIFTDTAWLWWNVVGAAVAFGAAICVQAMIGKQPAAVRTLVE